MSPDVLLTALAEARHRRDTAERDIRLLLAYGREVAAPPYRLADLAEAAGMSIPGVRIAYTTADVDDVTSLLAAAYVAAREHGTPTA